MSGRTFVNSVGVLELVGWIASAKGEDRETGPFYSKAKALVGEEKYPELFEVISKESGLFLTADEKDVEGLYNLLIALIRDSPPEALLKLIKLVTEPIVSSPVDLAHLKLKIFSNIYNSFDTNSPIRCQVFTAIVTFSAKADEMEIIVPQLSSLESMVKTWGASAEETRALYLLISEKLAETNDFKREGYEFLLKYLATFDNDSKGAVSAKEAALRAIKAGISIPTVVAFDDLHKLSAVQALKSTKNFELLAIFLEGSLKQYQAFVKANPKFVAENGLSEEDNQTKMRLLSLASLAAENVQGEVDYATIASTLDVSVDEVEVWVINTIRAGLIDAKMNQLKQTVVISRSVHRVFTEKEWSTLADRLEAWKTNLKEVLAVVGNAKLMNGGGATVEAVVQQ